MFELCLRAMYSFSIGQRRVNFKYISMSFNKYSFYRKYFKFEIVIGNKHK